MDDSDSNERRTRRSIPVKGNVRQRAHRQQNTTMIRNPRVKIAVRMKLSITLKRLQKYGMDYQYINDFIKVAMRQDRSGQLYGLDELLMFNKSELKNSDFCYDQAQENIKSSGSLDWHNAEILVNELASMIPSD